MRHKLFSTLHLIGLIKRKTLRTLRSIPKNSGFFHLYLLKDKESLISKEWLVEGRRFYLEDKNKNKVFGEIYMHSPNFYLLCYRANSGNKHIYLSQKMYYFLYLWFHEDLSFFHITSYNLILDSFIFIVFIFFD